MNYIKTPTDRTSPSVPAPKWTRFIGDLLRQQLLQLGFIPYFLSDKADKVTHHFQTGSRGMARRAHQVVEMRNFICGNIKRDDPVSRRFIQYLSMETWEIRALVRDRKTGRVLIQPPEEELWLMREKSGYGRASKNEFENIVEVGPEFFEKMDSVRQWHFGFEEYYDVYIWDASPGGRYSRLHRKLEEILCHAIRVKKIKDMFSVSAPIFKTITRDKDTDRVRSIRPGEDVETMWDNLDRSAAAWRWNPNEPGPDNVVEGIDESFVYTEADEIEDSILFPEEGSGEMKDNLFRANLSHMELFEKRPSLDMRRFVRDLDSDEELSDEDGYYSDDEPTDGDSITEEDDDEANWDTESDEMSEGSDDAYEFITAEKAEVDEAIEALSKHFKTTSISNRANPDYFLPILKDPASAWWIPESVRTSPPDLMAALRMSMKSQKDYEDELHSIEADFFRHIDREKSKVFKDCWHMGDLSPKASSKDLIWMIALNLMEDFVMDSVNSGPFELCKFMGMAPQFVEERRVVDDAFTAYASIALFYETDAFLQSVRGKMMRENKLDLFNTELLNQAERAKDLTHLNKRTHRSNKTMPKEFWADWDQLLKDNNRGEGSEVEDVYPLEWRKAMRPVVTHCKYYSTTTFESSELTRDCSVQSWCDMQLFLWLRRRCSYGQRRA